MSQAYRQLLQKAVALHQRGQLAEAIKQYNVVLAMDAENIDALHFKGLALLHGGDPLAAIELLNKVVKRSPRFASAYNNRGLAYQALRQPNEALRSFEKAISLNPQFAEAHYNKGNALRELRQLPQARQALTAAIGINPSVGTFHNGLGVVLKDAGDWAGALSCFDRALAFNPNDVDAVSNRATALRNLRRLPEALAGFDMLARLKPGFAEAHSNRGNVLKDLGRREEALASFDTAIALKPDFAEAYNNRAHVLVDLQRHDEAIADFERAAALVPSDAQALADALFTRLKICDWRTLDSSLSRLDAGLASGSLVISPGLALCVLDDPERHLSAALAYASAIGRSTEPRQTLAPDRTGRKIRVGYYSADFHNHATAYLMAELFEHHDRERFEFHGFALGPSRHDAMRDRIARAMDSLQEVGDLTDAEVAHLSRQRGIDIAVDLKGFTLDGRMGIFAAGCAPLQVSYLGYPGTTGADHMDYVIADRTVIPPDHFRFYREKVIHLPGSYQVNDSGRKIADRVFTRLELGLPEGGFVFCCFNNNYKILPGTFDIWMRILGRVEGSVLWLLADNPDAVRNLRGAAADRGIDPARLVFAQRTPLDEHLARHRAADLFLDTLPYNAHTTASDALWAGLPLLTCLGRAFPGRVAASLLLTLDLPELVAPDLQAYEATAVALARDPQRLSLLRQKLAVARLTRPLFNGKLFARNIEAAFVAMVARQDQGLPPEHMTVDAA